MNTLSAPRWTPKPDATATASTHRDAAALVPRMAMAPLALLACALVLALALLSYFVQVLNEHVYRGEQLRQTQHAAATKAVTEPRRPPPPQNGPVRTASR